MNKLNLPVVKFTKEHLEFRNEVRNFILKEKEAGGFETRCDSWLSGYSVEFSKKLGDQGWIGMTWPKKYGGEERSAIERYIVIEELLAAGAPVAAHWFADRQTGPQLLKYGTEEQKNFFLPKIAKGRCYFAIGLSEPNSGSDLASISTRAERTENGWILNGSKIWSSGAHYSHYMVVLCRTSSKDPNNRHSGLSHLIVDLQSPGVTVRPIKYLTGESHFNEVFFESAFIPLENLIGDEGNGWKQSMSELAYERSGPERILSTFPLLEELFRVLKEQNNIEGLRQAIKVLARLDAYRKMSLGVAQYLEEDKDVSISASLVKDLGTQVEKEIVEVTRLIIDASPSIQADDNLNKFLAESILHSPGFTLRGGTTEILRGIVTKGLISS